MLLLTFTTCHCITIPGGDSAKKYKKMFIVCILTWSLLGVKKSLGHAQVGLR